MEHYDIKTSFKYPQRNTLILAIVIFALLITGCVLETKNLHFNIRVKQTRCLNGFDPQIIGRCQGATAEAGIYEFRLTPSQKRALVRVIEQDPDNQSSPLFELDGCNVWDSKNWECAITDAGVIMTYSMNNGMYKHQFTTGIGIGYYYVGSIQNNGFLEFLN